MNYQLKSIHYYTLLFVLFGILTSYHRSFAQETQILDPRFETVSVQKIWDADPYNAFTDLARFRGAFYCTFRVGKKHAGGDKGSIRVIRSKNGQTWESVFVMTLPDITDSTVLDARDPKLSVTPDKRLMLHVGVTEYHGSKAVGFHPVVCFSEDGTAWTSPAQLNVTERWPWRPAWNEDQAWVVAYAGDPYKAVLMTGSDGINYHHHFEFDIPGAQPNEVTLRFTPEGRMLALLRDDRGDREAVIGWADPPYNSWLYSKTGHFIGGPELFVINDDLFLACGRMYIEDKKPQTVLSTLDLAGNLTPGVVLPSGGDTSYPGIVKYKGNFLISYYSSHEGKPNIYLAEVKFRDKQD